MAPRDTHKNSKPTDKFFENSDLDLETLKDIVKNGLKGADYGEFYHEIVEEEAIMKGGGDYHIISVGGGSSGYGFRVGQRERVGYSHSTDFNKAALRKTVQSSRKILDTSLPSFNHETAQGKTQTSTYTAPKNNPMEGLTLEEKIAKIDAIEAFVESLSPNIGNVSISYKVTDKSVHIVTADGTSMTDNRPQTLLNISVQLQDENGKAEVGSAHIGGAVGCQDVFNEKAYKAAAQKAVKQAQDLLIAKDAPAGIMDVVLAPGWPAVLLHEAVGHGLEGDFNRKGISVYSRKIGDKIASDEVTVIDQGDMTGERGSLSFDDEGTPTQKNVLIEKGVLKGYMQDRQSALLMKTQTTGNGRRQSYAHAPMPRMTNTYFENGQHNPEDIIKTVKDGIYIQDMGGGQVDITSGKFNMNARLGYRIRNGKLCEPIKGATLVGDGLTVIQSIKMVGNDLAIEKAAGTCRKNGQQVPISCGQPTVLVSNMVIGGHKK